MDKMTAKQKCFVAEYLIDLNATQAAIRAGYAKSGASVEGVRLLANTKVAAAVAAAVAKRSERTKITQDYVLASIMETMERCKQAEPVRHQNGNPVMVNTPDGDVAPAYKFDAGGVLRGAELLGRHLAMFTDNVRHQGKDGASIQQELTDKANAFTDNILAMVSRAGPKTGTDGA